MRKIAEIIRYTVTAEAVAAEWTGSSAGNDLVRSFRKAK